MRLTYQTKMPCEKITAEHGSKLSLTAAFQKISRFPPACAALLLLLFSINDLSAQSAKKPIDFITEPEVSEKQTQIAVRVDSTSPINKIRLFCETKGTSMIIEVPKSKVVVVKNVDLEDGDNIFNWIGYTDNTMVYASDAPFTIKKISPNGKLEAPDGDKQRSPKKEGEAVTKEVSGKVRNEKNAPLENAKVMLLDKEGKLLETILTDHNGKFSFDKVKPDSDEIKVSRPDFFESEKLSLSRSGESKEVFLDPINGRNGGEMWRVVVGYEQAGASASKSRRNIFFDFAMSVPLSFGRGAWRREEANNFPDNLKPFQRFGARVRAWGDVRISSVPNPTADAQTLSQFVTNFNQTVGDTKVNEVVQAFETTAGLEYRLASTPGMFRGLIPATKQRFSLSLIAGGGIVTPLSPAESGREAIFKVTEEAKTRYPQAVGKDFIAFVSPDRDRFYRQYFGGVRLKSLFFDKLGNPLDIYPANLDVTFGQNEAITGGGLRGGVMKFDGFYPLPIGRTNFLYLYGTAQMKLTRAQIFDNPLFLEDAPANTPLSGANTAIVTLPTINRDYYKIGIGVNPFKLFCALAKIECGGSAK